MVTRKDVARLANVSPAVVSYVINNSNYVSAEKRKAVLAAIEELNYIPNQNAKNLRQGRTHMIAVIRGSQMNDMFNDLLLYMENIAHLHGYHIAVITVSKSEDYFATDDFINALISRHYDAIFVTNSSFTEQQINKLATCGEKVLLYVTRDYSTLTPSVSCIVPNYRDAVKNIIGRLLDLGHRRIVILPNLAYPMDFSDGGNHRYIGYVNAFQERGLTPDTRYILGSCRDLNEAIAFVSRLFDKNVTPEPPTAICADEVFVVAGVMKLLSGLGLSIPKDVSLVCFSRSSLASVTTPELSTMGLDLEEFAEASMKMMEDLIDGSSGENVVIDMNYFEGQSMAPPGNR